MTFSEWRNEARSMILRNEHPRDVFWSSDDNLELGFSMPPVIPQALQSPKTIHVPPEFIECAKYVHAFRANDTNALLYRMLWRLIHEEPNLLKISIDDDTREFFSRYRLVKRDIHKMKAFVRFKEVDGQFIAWHCPDHLVVRLAAPFFMERFNGMNWSILTSDECVHWDQKELFFTEGLPRSAAPEHDDVEGLWKTYYKSIFNPARIKWKAMLKEMPARHWRTMPETAAIQDLLREAPDRLQKFYESQAPTADTWIPKKADLTLDCLKNAIPNCQACGICEKSTGPVMGVGPLNAEIAFVGEQPGDEEDKNGIPFIGPSGKLLNEALRLNQINREIIFVTNAVKGFKYQQADHYRIHRGSSPAEIAACAPWLKKELSIVKPKKIVCLGRSAAQSLLGKSVMMNSVRGQFFKTAYSDQTLVVPHPSFILRLQDPVQKKQEFERWVKEISLIKNSA